MGKKHPKMKKKTYRNAKYLAPNEVKFTMPDIKLKKDLELTYNKISRKN